MWGKTSGVKSLQNMAFRYLIGVGGMAVVVW